MIKEVISVVISFATFLSCSEAQPLSSTQSDITIQGSLTSACQSLTTRELEQKLETFGGYNKRYQAITKSGAAKFSKFISQPAPTKAPTLSTKKPRGRRQAPSYPITNLSSVARRGSLDQNGYHYLCTEWSAITTLSADYFPRYLNEVICDAKDVGCLSYEGICVQDSFIVNVLRNTGKCGSDGKQIWEVVSQPVRSCCSCRLFQGSFLGKYLWHFHFGLGLFSTPHKLYISVTSGVPSGALKWKINRSQQKFLK